METIDLRDASRTSRTSVKYVMLDDQAPTSFTHFWCYCSRYYEWVEEKLVFLAKRFPASTSYFPDSWYYSKIQ